MRTTLVVGILLIILLIAGLSYYRMVSISTNSRPVYDALPASTSIFFEFRDFNATQKALGAASFSQEIAKAGFLVKLKQETTVFDSIFGATSYTFSGNKSIASVYFTELNQFDYLYLIELKNVVPRDIKIAMRNVEDEKKLKVKERELLGEQLFDIAWPGYKKPLTVSFVKGVLIASFSSFLVEESIHQLKENRSIAKEKGFTDLQKVAGANADATIFIRFAKLDLLQSLLVNPENDSLFPFLKNFSGWMGADLTIKGNSFIINGYTASGDSNNTYLSQFKQGSNAPMTAAQILPSSTAVYVYRPLGDVSKAVGAGEPAEYTYLRSWSGNEAVFGIAEAFDKEFRQEYFLAVSTNSEENALSSLSELSKLAGDSSQIYDYGNYKIGRLRVGKTISNFYDPNLFTLVNPYFTVLKSHVIFANSENTIKNIISQYMNGQTLAKSSAYQNFTKNIADKGNIQVYVDPARSVEILNALLCSSLLDEISVGDRAFRKFSPMAIQFNRDGNAFFTTGFINYQQKADELTNQVWRTKLDTTALTAPQFVSDAQGEAQIMVQDAYYNVYLLNKAGRIIWKKNVGATVVGRFNSIDYFKNEQQEFIFNTTKEIYVLNQKGENVDRYPIKLPANATAGMVVIDPDGSRNYKYFVPCSNFAIYGYQATGKPLSGWSPQSKTGTVTSLQYVRYDSTDRIVAGNNSGTVMLFSLDGKKAMEPIRMEKVSFRSPFSLHQTDSTFVMVNADVNGKVHIVNQDGKQTEAVADTADFRSFVFVQNSAAGGYYIFSDTGGIAIYDKQFQKMNEFKPTGTIDKSVFAVNIPGSGKGFGLVSAASNKIFLFTPEMTLMDGFPLSGATAFDIAYLNKNEEKILVTVDNTGIVNAYRLK